jgi:hypothetical protein
LSLLFSPSAKTLNPKSFRQFLWAFGYDAEILSKAAARLEWTATTSPPTSTSTGGNSAALLILDDWEAVQNDLRILQKAVHALVSPEKLGSGASGEELVRFYDTMAVV